MYVGLFSCADLMKTGNEISWRYPYSVDGQAYKRNMIKLFSKNYDYNKLLKNVSCIAITDYNAGYASLLTHKIPIIDIHSGYSNEYGKKQMNSLLKKCDNIYTISTSATLDRTKTYVEEIGYTSTNNKNVSKVDFLNIDYDLVLFEIKKDN